MKGGKNVKKQLSVVIKMKGEDGNLINYEETKSDSMDSSRSDTQTKEPKRKAS